MNNSSLNHDQINILVAEGGVCTNNVWRIVILGIPLFAIILFMLGGNLLVVISVLRYKSLRTLRSGILASLAFADLLIAVTVLPFAAIDLICQKWIFSSSYCQYYVMLDFISCQSSIFHICLIAVEQYVVIVTPLRIHTYRRKLKWIIIACIVGIWLLSLIIAFYFIRDGSLTFSNTHNSTTINSDLKKTASKINSIIRNSTNNTSYLHYNKGGNLSKANLYQSYIGMENTSINAIKSLSTKTKRNHIMPSFNDTVQTINIFNQFYTNFIGKFCTKDPLISIATINSLNFTQTVPQNQNYFPFDKNYLENLNFYGDRKMANLHQSDFPKSMPNAKFYDNTHCYYHYYTTKNCLETIYEKFWFNKSILPNIFETKICKIWMRNLTNLTNDNCIFNFPNRSMTNILHKNLKAKSSQKLNLGIILLENIVENINKIGYHTDNANSSISNVSNNFVACLINQICNVMTTSKNAFRNKATLNNVYENLEEGSGYQKQLNKIPQLNIDLFPNRIDFRKFIIKNNDKDLFDKNYVTTDISWHHFPIFWPYIEQKTSPKRNNVFGKNTNLLLNLSTFVVSNSNKLSFLPAVFPNANVTNTKAFDNYNYANHTIFDTLSQHNDLRKSASTNWDPDTNCLYLSKLSPQFATLVFLTGFMFPMMITTIIYYKIYRIASHHIHMLISQFDSALIQRQHQLNALLLESRKSKSHENETSPVIKPIIVKSLSQDENTKKFTPENNLEDTHVIHKFLRPRKYSSMSLDWFTHDTTLKLSNTFAFKRPWSSFRLKRTNVKSKYHANLQNLGKPEAVNTHFQSTLLSHLDVSSGHKVSTSFSHTNSDKRSPLNHTSVYDLHHFRNKSYIKSVLPYHNTCKNMEHKEKSNMYDKSINNENNCVEKFVNHFDNVKNASNSHLKVNFLPDIHNAKVRKKHSIFITMPSARKLSEMLEFAQSFAGFSGSLMRRKSSLLSSSDKNSSFSTQEPRPLLLRYAKNLNITNDKTGINTSYIGDLGNKCNNNPDDSNSDKSVDDIKNRGNIFKRLFLRRSKIVFEGRKSSICQALIKNDVRSCIEPITKNSKSSIDDIKHNQRICQSFRMKPSQSRKFPKVRSPLLKASDSEEQTTIKTTKFDLMKKECLTNLDTPDLENDNLVIPSGKKYETNTRESMRRKIRKRESSTLYTNIQSNRALINERKAIKTLGIVLGAFLTCWTPYFLIFLIHPLCGYCVPVRLFIFVTWLGYLNSALNPIIYAIYNKKFREAFKRILKGFIPQFIVSQ